MLLLELALWSWRVALAASEYERVMPLHPPSQDTTPMDWNNTDDSARIGFYAAIPVRSDIGDAQRLVHSWTEVLGTYLLGPWVICANRAHLHTGTIPDFMWARESSSCGPWDGGLWIVGDDDNERELDEPSNKASRSTRATKQTQSGDASSDAPAPIPANWGSWQTLLGLREGIVRPLTLPHCFFPPGLGVRVRLSSAPVPLSGPSEAHEPSRPCPLSPPPARAAFARYPAQLSPRPHKTAAPCTMQHQPLATKSAYGVPTKPIRTYMACGGGDGGVNDTTMAATAPPYTGPACVPVDGSS
ncbi:hypothetical protein B0J13DRAFT_517961 [Dactylonectria estremocensis]|uniref:Uncharacterized protein n=1 Tax=Dactylonectria estremocensis TaxID=1079267 RepID=A0A9P9FJN1_9HYPO|nr:hypothetical protein B0J13DRAFT_517961 [Dactylonectria estremocensis]